MVQFNDLQQSRYPLTLKDGDQENQALKSVNLNFHVKLFQILWVSCDFMRKTYKQAAVLTKFVNNFRSKGFLGQYEIQKRR